MTRQEFIEGVTAWGELLDFCYDNDSSICEDIVSYDTMDEEVESDLRDEVGDRSWRDIRDLLCGIDTDYDYYRRDGSFNYYPLDNNGDFDEYKDEVLEWMDDNGYWDEEAEEEDFDGYPSDEYPTHEEEDDVTAADEDFSIRELIGMCSVQFLDIQRTALQQKAQNDTEFQQYLNNMPKVLR